MSATIWVTINTQEAYDRLVELIDSGYLSEALGKTYQLESFVEKIKAFAQQYGGYLPIAVWNRIIVNLPFTAAEQLPNIIEGYASDLRKISVGMGMTFQESVQASQKSEKTGKIELYDPADQNEFYYKSDTRENHFRAADGVILPPNLFDPKMPDTTIEYRNKTMPDQAPKRMSMEEEAQADAKYLKIIADQLGVGQMQEQMQQMQAQQQQQQQQPRDLMEALNGGPVPGYNPQAPQQEQQNEKKQAGNNGAELSQELDEAEDEAEQFNSKLASTLHGIKGQLPDIMALADKNPEAFKHSMDLINNLIRVAHSHNKSGSSVEKSEYRLQLEDMIEEFNKSQAVASLEVDGKWIWPVGTRKKWHRKTRTKSGTTSWREMGSGQVKDDKTGEPISVETSNRESGQQ